MDCRTRLAYLNTAMRVSQPLIYCVDDSADFRFLVGQVFKRFLAQYIVEFFESGTALYERLGIGSVAVPHLILMDGQMPGLSGPQTLSRLKQHGSWQNVPTVIISSSTSASDKQEAYASGAVEYVVKPINLGTLTQQLTLLCKRWTAEEAQPTD